MYVRIRISTPTFFLFQKLEAVDGQAQVDAQLLGPETRHTRSGSSGSELEERDRERESDNRQPWSKFTSAIRYGQIM